MHMKIKLGFFVCGTAAAVLMCADVALGGVREQCAGVWKGGASGLAKETYLVLRTDGTGAAFGVSERGEQHKAYEFEFEPAGDALKLKNRWAMRKGKRRDYSDGDECRLWVDAKSGKLMMTDGIRTNSFERASGMEDPFRRTVGKPLKDAVVGVWSGGSEFNACSMMLAKNGDAMVFFAVGGAFGKWSLQPNGDVQLLLDDSGKTQSMVAHYDASEDTMRLGGNRPLARNVKITPEEIMKPFKEKLRERDQRKVLRHKTYSSGEDYVMTYRLGNVPGKIVVERRVGEPVRLSLEENATTGFTWCVESNTNECTVVLKHRGGDKEATCGAPGMADISVTSLVRTPVNVMLRYRRAWEKDVEPWKTVHLVVKTIEVERLRPSAK